MATDGRPWESMVTSLLPSIDMDECVISILDNLGYDDARRLDIERVEGVFHEVMSERPRSDDLAEGKKL